MIATALLLLLAWQQPPVRSPKPDTEGVVAKADAALAQDPKNLDLLLAAARARDSLLRFDESIPMYTKAIAAAPGDVRFYRFRGHRYISTRKFDLALRDLEKAEKLAPSSFDVMYHVGLAHYLRGDFKKAADAYGRCLDTKVNGRLPEGWRGCAGLDTDSRIAISNWRYVALRRAGRHDDAKKLLDTITETMEVKENIPYFHALLYYKGLRTEEQIFDRAKLTGNRLVTAGYPVANFALISGNKQKACDLFRELVKDAEWAAFGFIAAEAELARGTCK